MKALTLWQPYAGAIAQRLKHFETRSWPTKYRGLILIHASVKPLTNERIQLAERYHIDTTPKGEIVAIARLDDCILMTPEFIQQQSPTELALGDWRVGRYAWQLSDIRRPPAPIKISGKQGLWTFYGSPLNDKG